MASKKLKRAIKVACIVVLPIFAFWFVFFQWRFIHYPPNGKDTVCYSPNHEYYIKRYQTVFESLEQMDFGEGIAILYDKSGKELYRGKAYLSAGPHWSENGIGKSSVFFQGAEYVWYIDGLSLLPIATSDKWRDCYDQPVGTVSSQ